MSFLLECFAISHIGNHRKNNEDNFYIGELISMEEQLSIAQSQNRFINKSIVTDNAVNRIFAVSDGMGGHEYGEVASYIVVDALAKFELENTESKSICENDKYIYIQSLQRKINQTNKNINIFSSINSAGDDMGATLSGVVVFSDEIVAINIGDSSVFLFEKNKLIKLTTDDNEAELFCGVATKNNSTGKRLTKYFGLSPTDGALTATITKPIPLSSEQIYIITTDGLTDYISTGMIFEIVRKNTENPELTANILLSEILRDKSNGRDNITVVILKIREK